jgi:uncharacterized Zn-binding protein involved in type VI secretion
MASLAAVAGDRITATCGTHQIPNPSSGGPQPAPPLPFSAPLSQGLATTVLIAGKPAATVGSFGVNTPAHPVVLHASDPHAVPATQLGTVTSGASRVLIEGRPAAYAGAGCTVCFQLAGTLTGSAATVLIGS